MEKEIIYFASFNFPCCSQLPKHHTLHYHNVFSFVCKFNSSFPKKKHYLIDMINSLIVPEGDYFLVISDSGWYVVCLVRFLITLSQKQRNAEQQQSTAQTSSTSNHHQTIIQSCKQQRINPALILRKFSKQFYIQLEENSNIAFFAGNISSVFLTERTRRHLPTNRIYTFLLFHVGKFLEILRLQ